ncbi:U11/U12 small nuclear ribonucleoprotein 65 kDa protein isoform X1 [Amborella trichopoda]|nr:U11/U12 small nuclear ribonucleoprotein 65 kDa protein isoform X1 [Amborella trichopoda]|eukprot:XP_006853102.2 U11/U12 small nuclear ribonucleoprotein 65 kDa protein isoform X1 [Amborella trichopoda]
MAFASMKPSASLNPTPQPQPLGTFNGEEKTATLLVRHLPEAIPHETLSRLFSHYGASSVRPCAGGRLRNAAFVDFKDDVLASQAQSQLNRLRFLGKVLSVERASTLAINKKHRTEEVCKQNASCTPDSFIKETQLRGSQAKGESIAISVSISEPIAPRLGVDYPFPPHLEYAYPPPDGNILTNIVNALIAVPRFYTQVLHLMNKMNLPAPFRPALRTPPLPSSIPVPPPPPPSPPPDPVGVEKPHRADISSDESELESSDEGDTDEKNQTVGSARKRVKRVAIVGPAVDKDVSHEAVGVKPISVVPKGITAIKKKNSVLQIKITPKVVQKEKNEDIDGVEEATEQADVALEVKPYATPQEIKAAKLPPEEILSLPMFKNYVAGNPSPVLYIKNLAKDVVRDDIYFIFGSLFGSAEAIKSGIDIKLMQEGRMRGQAFVTFPSTELAHHGLKLVNGYVFKGKPMIIQFGRNPATGKSS